MQIDKWRFGISPINWVNEDVLALGDHFTFEDLMRDFSALGFTGTEMCRKFPQDPKVLKQKLAEKGIQLSSQWKGVIFSDPNLRQEELSAYRKHVEFLHAMGSKHVVTCEIGGSPHADLRPNADRKAVQRLNSDQWKAMVEGLQQAGEICREYDMKLVYHYHVSTVVERTAEIDRLMEMTDPALVHLLYDTGHAYYGGSDPLALLKKHAHRIPYIHLKDVRKDVLDHVRQASISFVDSVLEGVFTVPGDGCIDFKAIFKELNERDYAGWMIIEAEQDPAKANPYRYAERTVRYIRSMISEL